MEQGQSNFFQEVGVSSIWYDRSFWSDQDLSVETVSSEKTQEILLLTRPTIHEQISN